MSGKPYTIRELKTIVDYLVEHKAYGEVRGRKMWMDFANTRLTKRTWQSLKEAFLKRILPDITNTYYRLDVDQIHSFKRGLNLTEKHKKHLDLEPVGNKSNNNDVSGDNEEPSTSNNNEENATGEDTTCSKVVHNRASTETLILENYYDTAENIQKDLEENTDEVEDYEQNTDKSKPKSKTSVKSIRDFIEYTEPLTPMLQEVLHDFATDDESDRMLIDEDYVGSEGKSNSPDHAVQSQSILTSKVVPNHSKSGANERSEEKTNHDSNKKLPESNEQPAETIEKELTKNNEELEKNAEASLSQFEDVMKLVDKALSKHLGCQLETQKDKSQEKTQNSNENCSAMTDSLLPNNQEAINSETFPNGSSLPADKTNDDQNGDQPSKKRKRSSSAEIIEKIKTKKQKNVTQSNKNNKKHSDTVEMFETNETSLLTDVEQNLDLNKEMNQNNINDSNADSGTEKNKAEALKKKRNLTLNNGKSLNTESKRQTKPVPKEKGTDHINSDSREITVNQSAQVENPCLKSVSLYAEQFSLTKYSDSEDGDGKKKTSEKILEPKQSDTLAVEKANDVILLKSRSNSQSENESPVHVSPGLTMKQRRDKIANIFGLTNGGQSRRMNGRKRTTSRRSYQYISSESSEWTSASDSEYVSPPRGHRYRYPRKHYKPHSGRVISLEECGGMYVMLGKKVYPITKHGKTVQNYVRKSSESDPDQEDNYWKNKYIEEKKRTFELKKILQKSKQNGVQIIEEPESSIEVPPLPPVQRQQRQSDPKESVNGDELATRRDTDIPEKQTGDKTLKIKFTKKDEEIQLEGYWQHINPVLAQVVSMFHKDPAIKQSDPASIVEVSSGTTTPRPLAADTGVKEKINKLESDIFNEIVEQHKEDVEPTPTEDVKDSSSRTSVEKDTNVTVRKKRGRPVKLIPPLVASSPSKRTERTPEPQTKSNDAGKEDQVISEVPPTVERRTTRTPKKLFEVATNATKQLRIRKSSAKSEENEDEVLYKFPSPPPTKRGKKSTTNVTSNAIETASNPPKPSIRSPEGLSNHSINSIQGYQDSDGSPFNIGLRKKRRFSVSSLSLKRKSYKKSRTRSLPNLADYETSESSNSSYSISVKSVTQSTINSEVHRSESYQLLMPRTKKMMHTLEKIEEAANELNTGNVTHRRMNLSVEIEVSEGDIRTASNDAASSSNISFPPSPELSIVENISVSKSMLTVNEDHPTINEMQSQLTAMNPNENKFLMSAVDVSMPLMAQECSLQKHLINVLNDFSDLKHAGRVLSTPELSAPRMSSMTKSIMNEINSVTNEGTLSDSLDRRLEELLLESAQKSTATKNQNLMEVDTVVKKNPRSKKRSSTPNKKKTMQRKTKIPEVSVVEEECKAHCSRNGRRSCPPSINIVYHEGNVPDNLQINIHEETSLDVAPVTKRKKAKKDIIKVKILKPKKKPAEKRKSPKARTSGDIECDDESGVFLQDTSDLIHNHSELCLFNKDCTRDRRRDSVEFIETSTQSIITLNSSASPEVSKENIDVNIVIANGEVTSELFCNNAQFVAEAKVSEAVVHPESDNTQYFTPLSPNSSIITEDLSDEVPNVQSPKPRPTKWYLLSEEDTTETSNTNYFDSYQDETSDVRSFAANLQQLFPVTCAIPDLSTITEMSEKSPKLGAGNRGDTDFDSQSIN